MALSIVFTSNIHTYRNNERFYDIPELVIKTFLGMARRGHSLFHKNLLLCIFLGSLISFIPKMMKVKVLLAMCTRNILLSHNGRRS